MRSDPFFNYHGTSYRFWILTDMREGGNRWGGERFNAHMWSGDRWLMMSRGPDGEEVVNSEGLVDYDSTNGTVSPGDLYLWGR